MGHNPQVLGSKPLEEQTHLEEINKIDNHAYANYPTKKGPNAQGHIWSSVMLSSSHLEESVNLMRKVVLKDVREKLRVFNDEIWLEVQGRFNQDHQDIDNATGEGFKFVWIKKPQLSLWSSEKGLK